MRHGGAELAQLVLTSCPHSGNRLANLTMYDVKQLYTAAKNYALNVSEIEAKVNEATSDDPWGASSTLMQEIAGATNNFQDFNEIMPAIYRNFMEKEAREWRQIYKVRTGRTTERCNNTECGLTRGNTHVGPSAARVHHQARLGAGGR